MMLRFFFLFFCLCSQAMAALDPAMVRQLADDDSDRKIAAIQALGASGDGQARPVLKALSEDALYAAGETIYILDGDKATDAITGQPLSVVPKNGTDITINNRIRAELDNALAGLRLADPDRAVRLAAAKELQSNVGADMEPLLAKALAVENDGEIKSLLKLAHAQSTLSSQDAAVRLVAVQELGESADPAVNNLLIPLTKEANEPDAKVRQAAAKSLRAVEGRQALGENLGRIFTGLSLGSILLLAALGLAITYGVMGVINMAHGEFLMIGAYATYVMQGLFQRHFPGAQDAYVLAAIPAAFLAAALAGMVLERLVIRRLYGRPLETLLATWGLSLILIQAARVIFGAQNVEVANPSWMSGGVTLLPSLTLPWNRIAIIVFAGLVLLFVWALMNRTRLGLFVRAVTQNRAMAGCVGVPTARMDTLAFGLGAGIAGLGGVALSQISNVGPDMGAGYIVDSFMVVVLGGVGQLAGAVWAALGLGIFTKFLEGWTGAVIAKVAVLVFIIVFIQKRPQGLFALKGRFVDQ